MNDDFERTNAALASSAPGRVARFIEDAIASAWRISATGGVIRSMRDTVQASPSTTVIRTIAMAVMIAAAIQPLLMRAMPATVVPAMPALVFVLIAMFAGVAAWQAERMAGAWTASAIGRLFRR